MDALPLYVQKKLMKKLERDGTWSHVKDMSKSTLIPENAIRRKLQDDKSQAKKCHLNPMYKKFQSAPEEESRHWKFNDVRTIEDLATLATQLKKTKVSTDEISSDEILGKN